MINQELKQILLDAQEDLLKVIKDASTRKAHFLTREEMIQDAANLAVFEVFKTFNIITPDAKYAPSGNYDDLIDYCAADEYFDLQNSQTWHRKSDTEAEHESYTLGYLFYNYLEDMIDIFYHKDTAHSESYMKGQFNKLVDEVQEIIDENSDTLTTLDDD